MEEKNNKISYPEILFITPLLLFMDLLDVMRPLFEGSIVFLPAGFFIGFLSLFVTALIQMYFIIKGIKNLTFLLSGIVDVFPIISLLPLKTTAWLITIVLVNKGVGDVLKKTTKLQK